jgi:hypothetical protein
MSISIMKPSIEIGKLMEMENYLQIFMSNLAERGCLVIVLLKIRMISQNYGYFDDCWGEEEELRRHL